MQFVGVYTQLKKIRARKNESTRSNKSNVRLIKSWCEGCCIPNDINTHNNNNNARILGSYIKHQYLEYQLYIFQLCKLFTSYYYYSRKKNWDYKVFQPLSTPQSSHIVEKQSSSFWKPKFSMYHLIKGWKSRLQEFRLQNFPEQVIIHQTLNYPRAST